MARCDGAGYRLMLLNVKSLEEMIRELPPPHAQRLVADLVRQLANAPGSRGKKLDQRWAGALKRYRDQYTSMQLQQKALEWRGD